MSSPEDTASLSREDLLVLVTELQRQVLALQEQVAQFAADNLELRAEVDRLTRQSKRQATPLFQGDSLQPAQTPRPHAWRGYLLFPPGAPPRGDHRASRRGAGHQKSCPGCGGRLMEELVDFGN
jgi:hypothetical protein